MDTDLYNILYGKRKQREACVPPAESEVDYESDDDSDINKTYVPSHLSGEGLLCRSICIFQFISDFS